MIVKLQAKIDIFTRYVDQSYAKSLQTVEKLKREINEIEIRINEKRYDKKNGDLYELNQAIEKLNKFIDFLIVNSERIQEKYKKLDNECKKQDFKFTGMWYLKALCEKTEKLATDLLCYSLAHFKKK